MEKTNEEVVTKILSDNEIIKRDYAEELIEKRNIYSTQPNYDLTEFLKNKISEPSRFGEKYIFVR